MNLNLICNVINIVDLNSDSKVARSLAEDYLSFIESILTSDYDSDTISLIREYLKQGNHPSDGMKAIFKDDKLKNQVDMIENFVDNALKA